MLVNIINKTIIENRIKGRPESNLYLAATFFRKKCRKLVGLVSSNTNSLSFLYWHKKKGNVSDCEEDRVLVKITFGIKNVYTKYSRVLGISKIDFTPAEITATGVLPSSVRSDDISIAAKYKLKGEAQLT